MEKKKPKGLRPNMGDKYKNLRSELCFVNYKDKEIIKLCYICDSSYTEVWDRKEFIEEVKKFHFFLVPKEKITRLNIADHLLEYQLNMIGKTMAEARKDELEKQGFAVHVWTAYNENFHWQEQLVTDSRMESNALATTSSGQLRDSELS